jgi:hypothetical protein
LDTSAARLDSSSIPAGKLLTGRRQFGGHTGNPLKSVNALGGCHAANNPATIFDRQCTSHIRHTIRRFFAGNYPHYLFTGFNGLLAGTRQYRLPYRSLKIKIIRRYVQGINAVPDNGDTHVTSYDIIKVRGQFAKHVEDFSTGQFFTHGISPSAKLGEDCLYLAK